MKPVENINALAGGADEDADSAGGVIARRPRTARPGKARASASLRCRMCERGNLERLDGPDGQAYYRCRHCEFLFTPGCDEQTADAYGLRHRRMHVYTTEGRWAVDPSFLCPALERLGHRGALRILDFGAADSIVPDLLRQGGHRVIALAPGNTAAHDIPGAGGHPDRITGDILELNIPEAQFDLTYAYQVLEHLPEPRPVLRELLRLTKPGGYVLVHGEMGDADPAELSGRLLAEQAEGVCCRFTHRTFEVFVRGSSHAVAYRDEHTVLIKRDAKENG